MLDEDTRLHQNLIENVVSPEVVSTQATLAVPEWVR